MSRINKAFYVLDMVSTSGSIYKGSVLLGGNIQCIKRGKIKKSSFYYVSFKKLSDLFCLMQVRDWAMSHNITDEADVEYENSYGEIVYLYEL